MNKLMVKSNSKRLGSSPPIASSTVHSSHSYDSCYRREGRPPMLKGIDLHPVADYRVDSDQVVSSVHSSSRIRPLVEKSTGPLF